MFHVFTKDILKIHNFTTNLETIYYYKAFPNKKSAFKQGIINAIETEEEDFPLWLESSVGLAAKNTYNKYLENFKRDMSVLLKMSSYQGISFDVLNFKSPVETYQRIYIFANDFSKHEQLLRNLLGVPDFTDWFYVYGENTNANKRLMDHLLSQQESDFESMLNAFIHAQLRL